MAKRFLFHQTKLIASENLIGIEFTEQQFEMLLTLKSTYILPITFLFSENESDERRCYIVTCERPERTDSTISENGLVFTMTYYGTKKEKVLVKVKINTQLVEQPTAKNDMFEVNGLQDMAKKTKLSVIAQKGHEVPADVEA